MQETQFDKKLNKHQELRQTMNCNQALYSGVLEVISYLRSCKNLGTGAIKFVGKNKRDIQIVLVKGIQLKQDNVDSFYYDMVSQFEQHFPAMRKSYYIVFQNTGCQNLQFQLFKDKFLELPTRYWQTLQNILLVGPSFSQKYLEWFSMSSHLQKYLKSKILYFNKVRQLQVFGINQKILAEDYAVSHVMLKAQIKQHSHIKRTFEGKRLRELEGWQKGVPHVFLVLVGYFEKRPQNFKLQGIFRKVGSIQEIQQLQSQLVSGNLEFIDQVKSCHTVSSLIKKILNKSSDSIFSPEGCLQLQNLPPNDDQAKQYIRNVITTENNLIFIHFLGKFFKKINSFEKSNLMSIKNLSICLGPCLIKSKNDDMFYIGKSTNFARLFLQHFQFIFKDDLVESLQKTYVRRISTRKTNKQKQTSSQKKQAISQSSSPTSKTEAVEKTEKPHSKTESVERIDKPQRTQSQQQVKVRSFEMTEIKNPLLESHRDKVVSNIFRQQLNQQSEITENRPIRKRIRKTIVQPQIQQGPVPQVKSSSLKIIKPEESESLFKFQNEVGEEI